VPAATPQGEIAVVAGCDVYEEGDLNFVLPSSPRRLGTLATRKNAPPRSLEHVDDS
jgi:hypothetical protein